MHLYVATKGNILGTKQWAEDLKACKVPYKWDKDKPVGLWRVSPRPIQLWEVGFPEDQLEEVLGMVGLPNQEMYALKRYPFLNRWIKRIRKLLKLQEVPLPTKIYEHMQPNQFDKAVAVFPIGLKKDEWHDGIEQL